MAAATGAMLERRRAVLADGAEALGWKVGFNLPAIQEKLGIEAPLAGFLSSAGLVADGATLPLGGAAHGRRAGGGRGARATTARTIAALLPALEVADPPDLSWDVERILAGNIFHRAVAFGPRVETATPGRRR